MRAGARVFVLLGLVACSKSEPPAPAPASPVLFTPAPAARAQVATDLPRYPMTEGPYGPQTTIGTSITAPADHPAHIANCNGAISLGLQRREGDAWVHAWAAEINGCASAPIVVPPGGRWTETMVVASGRDALVSSRRNSSYVPGGTYRVVWHAVEGLPLEERASPPFVIDPPPPHDPTRESPAVRPMDIRSVEPAHGANVGKDARVRIRFARRLEARLYVDGEHVSENEPPRSDVVEHSQRWTPGRHELRVVWQDEQRRTLWYAWSFVVDAIPPDIKPGATLLGLRVVSSDLKPAVNGGYVGNVRFQGEVTVGGEFARHLDPDVKDSCFFVDAIGARKLPRLAEDVRKSWFCFTNPEAMRKAFGSPPAAGTRATIRIADFHYVFHYSDVYNEARFVARD